MSGLIFDNEVVGEISGPVSMYIINPSSDKKFKNLYLPTMILFGDQHDSKFNSCENKDNNTYDLDVSFFKLFENYSSPSYPIDVYLEQFDNIEIYKNKKCGAKSILGSLIEDININSCFRRQSENYKNCHIPSLRWHMADVRYSHTKGLISFEAYLNLTFKQGFFPVSDAVFNEMCEQMIYSLYDDNKKKINFKDFVYSFFEKAKKIGQYSLINKQILKKQKDISIYTINSIFEDILIYHFSSIKRFAIKFYKIFPTFDSYKYFFFNFNYDDKEKIVALKNLSLFVGASLFDLYTILRILKVPDNGLPPVLVIGYFGNAHSNSINFIMKKYFNYKNLFNQNVKKKKNINNIKEFIDNYEKYKNIKVKTEEIEYIINSLGLTDRCITINKSIDIDKLIKERIKVYKNIKSII